MSDETLITEITFRDIVEILLHGAVYDEESETEDIVALRLEEDKTLRTFTLHVGHDSEGNERVFLTDPNGVPLVMNAPASLQVDPVGVPNAEADLWVPPAPFNTAAETYAVEFDVVNVDGGVTVQVTIGQGIGGAVITLPTTYMFAEPVPPWGATGWLGPYIIAGDDTIRGFAPVANDASIHFRIRRLA